MSGHVRVVLAALEPTISADGKPSDNAFRLNIPAGATTGFAIVVPRGPLHSPPLVVAFAWTIDVATKIASALNFEQARVVPAALEAVELANSNPLRVTF